MDLERIMAFDADFISSALLILLFFWYTLIMTGFKIRSIVICTSAVKEKSLPEIILWAVFLALIPSYIFTSFVGNVAAILFLLMWIVAQYFFTLRFILFPNAKRIQAYNRYFANTHHIIKPSPKRLVPDTYHIVLFALIFACLIATLINLILQ